MERKEEIVQQAVKEFPRFAERRVGFITGAEWADEHPRKGLVDIEKVCEWLENNIDGWIDMDYDQKAFVKEFKQAVEEQV